MYREEGERGRPPAPGGSQEGLREGHCLLVPVQPDHRHSVHVSLLPQGRDVAQAERHQVRGKIGFQVILLFCLCSKLNKTEVFLFLADEFKVVPDVAGKKNLAPASLEK